MKYVIEINDHPMNDSFTPALYRAKGFKTLVFDEYGLSKLTPLNEEVYSTKNAVWNNGFVAGKQIGIQEVKQEYFNKGYRVGKCEVDKSQYDRGYEEGKTDADMEGYDRGYDSGYAQCKKDMKCGYDEGVEAGKNVMKEIVINNLRKILERG